MNRQMNKRSVITTIVVFVVCLIIVTGSTFSLFTSESNVNIAITSGKVEMLAEIDTDSLKLYSKGVEQTKTDENGNRLFQNSGYAVLGAKTLDITNITPGDKAIFEIELNNTSNIDIQYCVTWTVETLNGGDESLANALVATADGTSMSTLEPTYTPWIAADADNKTIEVAVELPLAYEKQTDSNVKINFHVEAVQANGYTPETKVESVDELVAAFAEAEPGDVIDATGVTYPMNGAEHFTIPAGITLKGLTVTANYRGLNYIMWGEGTDPITFENCTFGETSRNTVLGGTANGPTSVVYNNCTFTGQVITNFVDNADGVATFNNCVFTKAANSMYNFIEAMGGKHIFNNCTFDYTGVNQASMGVLDSGKLNVYSETEYSTYVETNGCKFINCGRRQYGANSTLVVK